MKDQIKRRAFLRQLLFYVVAVVCNIVPNHIVKGLGLPLYVDNIGTMSAAVMGGYLPGILVGYITNIVNMQADPDNAYYAVLSAMIAAAATYLGSRGFFKDIRKLILTVPIFAFLGGALGSILTYLMYGLGDADGIWFTFARDLFKNGTLTLFQAQMLSDVTADLIDKAITVLIVFVILKLLPESFRDSLRLTGWKQVPLSISDQAKAKKKQDQIPAPQRQGTAPDIRDHDLCGFCYHYDQLSPVQELCHRPVYKYRHKRGQARCEHHRGRPCGRLSEGGRKGGRLYRNRDKTPQDKSYIKGYRISLCLQDRRRRMPCCI